MISPDELKNRMMPQSAIQQPRPFDTNEPCTRAPVPEPGDEDTPPTDPTEHAEIPHAPCAVVEGDGGDSDDAA